MIIINIIVIVKDTNTECTLKTEIDNLTRYYIILLLTRIVLLLY